MTRSALAAVFVLLASPASAQQTPQVDCTSPSITQMELNFCAEQAWMAADADLNLAYRQALTQAKVRDGDDAAQDLEQPLGMEDGLRVAQRAWIPFRDAACSAEATLAQGGSIQPMVGTLCLERLTRRRTEDLLLFARPMN